MVVTDSDRPGRRFKIIRRLKAGRLPLTPAVLTLTAFLFYLATLAPTILWGDDAFFQWSTAVGYLQPDGGGHWLHFTLARLFTRLPVGDVAYRVNLFSAVAAALTILFIFLTGRSLRLSIPAAAAAAISLAVSHTFWTHAVRAEVYTLFTLMLALILWLLLSWREERPRPLYAALLLIGPALLSHQMTLLFLPALALFLWLRRSWLQAQERVFTILAFLSGLIIAAWVIHLQVGQSNLLNSLAIYFTQSGADFRGAILDLTLFQLPADAAFWIGMLGLQFFGPAFILGLLAIFTIRRMSATNIFLLTFYATTVIFAATYRVNDRYAFFLPGYLVFALLVGHGWQVLRQKRPSLSAVAFLLLLPIPLLTYALLPPLMETTGLSLPGARQLPGREPATFFLWPAKNDYTAAADFSRSTFNHLPPNSILISDHTPYEPLNYLQKVEGLRPDVLLIKIEAGQDLQPLLISIQDSRPIFLADNNPTYYNLTTLPNSILHSEGFVYRLTFQ